MTVCASFGLSRERMKSGMRIAGSVGASTAPTSSETFQGRSNAKCAAIPTTAAVISMPGTASSASVTHTFRRTGSDSDSPP